MQQSSAGDMSDDNLKLLPRHADTCFTQGQCSIQPPVALRGRAVPAPAAADKANSGAAMANQSRVSKAWALARLDPPQSSHNHSLPRWKKPVRVQSDALQQLT